MTQCTIITIGDELLIGQVIDTNSAFIAKELNKIGISVHQRIAIADDETEIIDTIHKSMQNSAIVITTGGLGPTKDDITKKCICKLFKTTLVRNIETYEHVERFFISRNREFTPINQAQADIPAIAEVLFNKMGTAPGIWIEKDDKIVINLPGVPFEMEHLITTHVIQKLLKQFQLPALYYAHIQTAGLGESFLAQKIEDIEDQIPTHIKLAYLPSTYRVHLRLSGTHENKDTIDRIATQIKERLHDYIYGTDTIDIFLKVLMKLLEKKQTISFIESCTGGYLAHEFTNNSGASECFKGSYVVYSDSSKQDIGISSDIIDQYSVYSPECAEDMHKKLLMKTGSDYGISTTGHLEPSNGLKPKVYIAYGNSQNIKTLTLEVFYPRVKNKEMIAQAAMIQLYKEFLLII